MNKNTYEELLNTNMNISYLSPAYLKSLENREKFPNHSKIKSDIFSIGMIGIFIASKASVECCYNNYPMFSLNKEEIDNKFEIIEKSYSSLLLNFIKTMTMEDENKRPSITFIFDIIAEIQEKNLKQRFQQKIVEKSLEERLNNLEIDNIEERLKKIDPLAKSIALERIKNYNIMNIDFKYYINKDLYLVNDKSKFDEKRIQNALELSNISNKI